MNSSPRTIAIRARFAAFCAAPLSRAAAAMLARASGVYSPSAPDYSLENKGKPSFSEPPPRMNRKDMEAYARSVAGGVGLAHWKLEFPDEPPADADAYASVTCWDKRNGATLRFADGLLKESPEEQRHCVVHELVHCHLAHADKLAERLMGPREADAWRVAMEYGVDALAAVIAPGVPLPVTPAPDEATPAADA